MFRCTTTAPMATTAPASPDSARLELSTTSSTSSVTGGYFAYLLKYLLWSLGIGVILAEKGRMPCPLALSIIGPFFNLPIWPGWNMESNDLIIRIIRIRESFSLQLNCKGGSTWTAALWPTTTVSTTTICSRRKRPENNLDPPWQLVLHYLREKI